jgi:hypothetical protein
MRADPVNWYVATAATTLQVQTPTAEMTLVMKYEPKVGSTRSWNVPRVA